jgi:hypothetical protein
MATATFNTGIAIPLGENTNIYNLDEVITTAGFGGFGEVRNFQYALTTETTGVTVEDNRMAIESSASGGISIRVSDSEEGEIEAIATTNLYFPYTAIFNTSIETPSSGIEPNSYDLNTVITKYGFENITDFTYKIVSGIEGLTLQDNILSINESAYGVIVVEVTGVSEKMVMQANARTKTYGFYSTRLELINNESVANAFQNAIVSTKNDWSSLVGANRKAGGGRDDLDSGAEITPGGGIKNP